MNGNSGCHLSHECTYECLIPTWVCINFHSHTEMQNFIVSMSTFQKRGIRPSIISIYFKFYWVYETQLDLLSRQFCVFQWARNMYDECRDFFTIATLNFFHKVIQRMWKTISMFCVFIYICMYVGWKTGVSAYQMSNRTTSR